QTIFDYFATEIFRKMDLAEQDFLVKTALFPSTTEPLARTLTGFSDAARLLGKLHRQNFFTERRGTAVAEYEYHPLFRAFLLHHAEVTFDPATLRALQNDAAALLAGEGRADEALELFGATANVEAATNLIL